MKKKGYCETYDSLYGRFGKWLEGTCEGPNCEYCADKPKRHPRKCNCKKDFFDITDIKMMRELK